MTTRTTDGCLCGAVRYELSAPPVFQFACHCRGCQYASGGSPTLGLIEPSAAVTVTQGEVRVHWSSSDSGARVGRCFCETCGTPLFSKLEARPELMVVKVGSLDDPSLFHVQSDMWMKSAQPWHRPHDGAAQFAGNPDG